MTRSARFLPIGLGLVALLRLAGPVLAQSAGDTLLLSLPVGEAILCNVPALPASSAVAHLQVRQFRFGNPSAAPMSEWPRRIFVAADSGGRPTVLNDMVISTPSSGAYAMAQFSPNGDVSGWRQEAAWDTAAVAAAAIVADGNLAQLFSAMRSGTSPGPLQPPDSAEQGKARALAAWLWERRCGRA